MVANSIINDGNEMEMTDANPLLFSENSMFIIIRNQINSGLENQKQVG
jgi:hypothetical protein